MRRPLIIAVAVVLALLIAGGLAARWLVDSEAVGSALERQASAAIGHPVSVGEVDWALSLQPRLVLSGIQIGDPAAITIDRLELTTGLRALLSKRVEGATIVVSGSRVTLPLPIAIGAETAGTADAAPEPQPGGPPAFVVDSIDRIGFENIELVGGERSLRLDAESALAGDRLTISSLSLRSERTTVTGHGEIASLRAREGELTLIADPLDLDELLAVASALSGPRPQNEPQKESSSRAPLPPLALRLEIKAPSGRIVGIDFADLATTLSVNRGGVTLDPLSVGTFGGTVTGRLHLDTTGPTPQATITADLSGIDAARLAAFAGSSGVLTGRLNGRMALGALGTSAASVFRSARGKADVAITDGTLPGLDLVGPAVLAFGKPDPAKSSGRSRSFSRLGGTFALADGVLQSNDLWLASPDLDLAGRGTLRVDGAVADLRADLKLSEDLSSQAGRDLYKYAHDGPRVVLPATVKGPLASPSVSIDLGAAAGRALRNEVDDQVKKALERLRKP